MALKDPSTRPNPRDISLDEMKQLYINSYEGYSISMIKTEKLVYGSANSSVQFEGSISYER